MEKLLKPTNDICDDGITKIDDTTNSKPESVQSAEKYTRLYDKDVDKGWAWIVLVSTFVAFFLFEGQILTSNIYFIIYLEAFQQPRSITALVGAAYTAFMYLSGPLTSFLLPRVGARYITMIGAILTAVGYLCLFTANSIIYAILYNGILRGIGGGFLVAGTMAGLAKYFNKRLYVATGIMYSAATIGMMTISLVTEYLTEYYGWRGSMLIQSGIILNVCVCASLLYKLPKSRNKSVDMEEEDSNKKSRSALKEYLMDSRFWCIMANGTLFTMFMSIEIVLWKDLLLVKDHFKMAVVAMAIGSTCGRATGGFVSDRIPPPIHNALAGILSGVAIFGFLFADRIWSVIVHNFVWGFLNGQQSVADRVQITWVYGRKEMPIISGYLYPAAGIGGFISPPLGGWIADLTGSYTATLSMAATWIVISSAISVLLFFNHKKLLSTKKKMQEIGGI